jgi:hypothetical protein
VLRDWMAADLATVKRIATSGPTNSPLVHLTWQLGPVPGISITAAPLAHRLPCWGYVFQVQWFPVSMVDGHISATHGAVFSVACAARWSR